MTLRWNPFQHETNLLLREYTCAGLGVFTAQTKDSVSWLRSRVATCSCQYPWLGQACSSPRALYLGLGTHSTSNLSDISCAPGVPLLADGRQLNGLLRVGQFGQPVHDLKSLDAHRDDSLYQVNEVAWVAMLLTPSVRVVHYAAVLVGLDIVSIH